jgi:hypothetical protein
MVALWIVAARVAHAQTLASSLPLPRIFVGGGVGVATVDVTPRTGYLTAVGGDEARFFRGEIGVAPWRRIGFGVELGTAPTLATGTTHPSAAEAYTESEWTLIPVARGRIASSARVAIDVVGGLGLLFEHHEQTFTSYCPTACTFVTHGEFDRRAPAWTVGIDMPVEATRFLWVSGFVRTTALERDPSTARYPPTQPSTQLAAGVTARVGWRR